MPEFEYRARDAQGVMQTGRLEAPNRQGVVQSLRDNGWIVVAVNESREQRSSRRPAQSLRAWLPVRPVDVETGLMQMAVMMRSGVTTVDAALALAEQSRPLQVAGVWTEIAGSVARGRSLSTAMVSHAAFPEYVRRLVRTGEQTGVMHPVLEKAARLMREKRTAREAFTSALFYPLLLLVLCLCVTAYMLIWLVPRLEDHLNSLGKDIPPMTRLLVDISTWLADNSMQIAVAVLAGLFAILLLSRSEGIRQRLDQWLFAIPLVGNLMRIGETRMFAQSLAAMLSSGMTVTDSLASAELMSSNRYVRQTIATCRQRVINGSNLVDALQGQNALTPLLSRMIAAGESSGQLGYVLEETAVLHEAQYKAKMKQVTAILGPLGTLVIGGLVGYVYIAFFTALMAAGS